MLTLLGAALLIWSAWLMMVVYGYLRRPKPTNKPTTVVLVLLGFILFAGLLGGIGLWLVFR